MAITTSDGACLVLDAAGGSGLGSLNLGTPNFGLPRRGPFGASVVVRGQEPHNGQQQRRGVQSVGAVVLGVGAGLLAPSVLEDGGAHLVPRRGPRRRPVAGVELVGHGQAAVQRHPAHQLAVQVGACRAAHLPDALVVVCPAGRGGVHRGHEELPGRRVEGPQLGAQGVGGVEQRAVHVELALVPGPVPGPDRSAVSPARQVPDLALGEIPLAADPEHDLQVQPAVELGARGAGQEREEPAGLVGAGGDEQALQGHRRVADPGEPVVPGAGAADSLGQAGGGCGDHRAAAGVGQAAQHHPAVVHQFAQRPVVALVQHRPALPGGLGAGEAAADLPRRPRGRWRAPRVALGQGEHPLLAFSQDPAGRGVGPSQVEGGVGAQHKNGGRAGPDHPAGGRSQAGVHQPELGARRELHPHGHRPPTTADAPQEHAGGAVAQLVSPLAVPQCHCVDDHQLALGSRPRRFQH